MIIYKEEYKDCIIALYRSINQKKSISVAIDTDKYYYDFDCSENNSQIYRGGTKYFMPEGSVEKGIKLAQKYLKLGAFV